MLLFHASLFDLATWLILSLFLLFKFRFSESLEPQLNIHRIIESLGLEETLQIILFQPLPWKFWSMNCNIRYATDLNNTLLHFQPHRVLVSTPVTNIRHRKKKLFLWWKVSIWYIIHYQPTYKMLGFMQYFAHEIFTDAHQYYLRMQHTVTDLFGKSTR